MSDRPLVSIVIPCYNYGKFLEEAIESCLGSTYPHLEILVVNDGSTDPHTIKVLEHLDKPRTTIIHQENKRLPAARNAGIAKARGELILALDADDLIEPTYIEKAVWVMQSHPEVGMVSPWLQNFGDEDWVWRPDPFNFHQLLFGNSIPVASIFRKAAWELAGGYDERMIHGYEDWDFWIALAKHGYLGYQIPEVLFWYRRHGTTMIHGSRERHEELVAQIRENHPELYQEPRLSELAREWGRGHLLVADAAEEPALQWLKALIKPLIPLPIKRLLRGRSEPAVPAHPEPDGLRRSPPGMKLSKQRRVYVYFWQEGDSPELAFLDSLEQHKASPDSLTLITTLPVGHALQGRFSNLSDDVYHLSNYFSNRDGDLAVIERLLASRPLEKVWICQGPQGDELRSRLLRVLSEAQPSLSSILSSESLYHEV